MMIPLYPEYDCMTSPFKLQTCPCLDLFLSYLSFQMKLNSMMLIFHVSLFFIAIDFLFNFLISQHILWLDSSRIINNRIFHIISDAYLSPDNLLGRMYKSSLMTIISWNHSLRNVNFQQQQQSYPIPQSPP